MSPVFRILIVFLFLQFAGLPDSSAESPFKFESTPGKLPKDIVPRHYSIYLHTDLEKFVTAGKVEIEIEALSQGLLPQTIVDSLDAQRFLQDNEEFWPFEGEDWEDEYVGGEGLH